MNCVFTHYYLDIRLFLRISVSTKLFLYCPAYHEDNIWLWRHRSWITYIGGVKYERIVNCGKTGCNETNQGGV